MPRTEITIILSAIEGSIRYASATEVKAPPVTIYSGSSGVALFASSMINWLPGVSRGVVSAISPESGRSNDQCAPATGSGMFIIPLRLAFPTISSYSLFPYSHIFGYGSGSFPPVPDPQSATMPTRFISPALAKAIAYSIP